MSGGYDPRCRVLAAHFLRDYDLSPTELAEETERLAASFQQVAEAELEHLEHRRKA